MGALDGFYSTWNKARETFGRGTPDDGAQYDGSSRLLQMKARVEAAAPDDRWQGSGSQAYAAANKDHATVYEKLAELDKKMAGEVKNAASVVTVGRTNLDTAKGWVDHMVNSLPATNANDREQKLIPIAREGISKVDNIVKTSTDKMVEIKGNVDKLKGEFDTVKTTMKFGPDGEKNDDVQALTDKEKTEAEEDVRNMLQDGDQAAAAHVEEVLSTIEPYQELTSEQAAYLNEMEEQQADMSVKDLKSAEDRLGDKGHIIGDSWQLMSNDDVPRSAGKFDDQQKGGFDRLPQSVQDAIKSSGVFSDQQMQDIAAIVKDGKQELQTGTELDREMMRKADRMMDAPIWERSTGQPGDGSKPQYDVVLQDIFDSAGRDHQIVHDHLTGILGDDGQDFMKDISTHEWNDDGKAAGSLFEWTKNSEDHVAAETANVYAEFLGRESDDLLAIDGNRQIGDVNPELVKAFSNGLMPYQEELVTDQPGVDTPFKRLDDLGSTMDKTKGLFAVIDSQPEAARDWNKTAYQNALDMQESFAQFAKEHPDLPKGDARLDDLQSSARLLGAIDGGMHQETLSNIENGKMSAEQALENAKSAYEFKKDIIRSVFSYGPGGDLVTNTFADTFAGPPPEASNFKFDEDGTITDVGLSANEQSVQHQITQAQYTVASQFVDATNPHIDERFFDADGKLMPPSQIPPEDWSLYDSQLSTSMAQYTQINTMLGKFSDTFGHVGGSHS